MNNAGYSTEPHFVKACEAAGIPATAAQASKYRRGYGLAFTTEKGFAAGSRVQEKASELSEAQAAGGKPGVINDYGPYSTTPWNQKPNPHPKTKMVPVMLQSSF